MNNQNVITCKYCGLTTVSLSGSYKNVKRYLCKSCGHKFKADDNIYYMRVPAPIIDSALNMFYSGTRPGIIKRCLEKEYNYSLSRAAIYQWINKYTLAAAGRFQNLHPSVGDTWIIGKTFFYFGGNVYKISDIIDSRTCFLLASSLTLDHNIKTFRSLMKEAEIKAGKYPEYIMGHMHYSYFQKIKKAFRCEAEHMHNQLSAFEYNVELVEIFRGAFLPRLEIMHHFRSLETAQQFHKGWSTYHNFFLNQERLNNKTPAEAAGLEYPVRTWSDLVELRTSKAAD